MNKEHKSVNQMEREKERNKTEGEERRRRERGYTSLWCST